MRQPGSSAATLIIVAFLPLMFGTGCSRKSDSLPPLNSNPGSLEFCIAANEHDDKNAIVAAREYFESVPNDVLKQKELRRLAEEGLPPLPPSAWDGLPFSLNHRDVTYRWVELDSKMIEEMKLDQTIQDAVQEARNKGTIAVNSTFGRYFVLWSRPCLNKGLSDEALKAKKFDYFMLIRNADPGKEVTEVHLVEFSPSIDRESSRPIIEGRFNEEGAKRMFDLTTENKPGKDGKITRHLAIIIQRKVFSTPTLQAAIKDRFQLSGDFTTEYVNDVVNRVRTAGN